MSREISFGRSSELVGDPVRIRFSRISDGYWYNGSTFQASYDAGPCRFLMIWEADLSHYYTEEDPGVPCNYTAESDTGIKLDYDQSGRETIKQIIETADGGINVQEAFSIMLAVLAGVTDTDGLVFRTPDGTSVRVTATVDANRNRTVIVLTPASP